MLHLGDAALATSISYSVFLGRRLIASGSLLDTLARVHHTQRRPLSFGLIALHDVVLMFRCLVFLWDSNTIIIIIVSVGTS